MIFFLCKRQVNFLFLRTFKKIDPSIYADVTFYSRDAILCNFTPRGATNYQLRKKIYAQAALQPHKMLTENIAMK
jgi:hypothetical protein